jgi:alkylated DNA repair dioxygenase AlkB
MDIPLTPELKKTIVVDLKEIAKRNGLSGYSKLKKEELIEFLRRNRKKEKSKSPTSPIKEGKKERSPSPKKERTPSPKKERSPSPKKERTPSPKRKSPTSAMKEGKMERSPSPKKKSNTTAKFEYQEKFIKNPNKYFKSLVEEVKFEQKQVHVFGKTYNEPRLTAIHGDDNVLDKEYVYSKSIRKLSPMTPSLKEIQSMIENYTGIHFDFVLLNYYRDGNDKVGWHSDDEKMMDCSNIVSISLGAERPFKFREKTTHKVVWKETLKNGSMVWMKGGCQEEYEHEVPKSINVSSPRINLTFRKFK